MHHLFPIRRIVVGFAVVHLLLILVTTSFIDPTVPLAKIWRYSGFIIPILDFAFLLTASVFWRFLWKHIPALSEQFFPDLNGVWEGKLAFGPQENLKSLLLKARIHQNLWGIKISMETETSESNTLVAYPTIESGQKILYYIYRNVPNNPEWDEFKGTSVLKVDLTSRPISLAGHYFTVRNSKGRIELTQLHRNPNHKM